MCHAGAEESPREDLEGEAEDWAYGSAGGGSVNRRGLPQAGPRSRQSKRAKPRLPPEHKDLSSWCGAHDSCQLVSAV